MGTVELIKVYYAGAKANKVLPQNYHIREPAGNGYAHALVIRDVGKTVLVFDPFNFQGWNIASHAGEINTFDKRTQTQTPLPGLELDKEFWLEFLLNKWQYFTQLNMTKDWQRAAVIIKALGGEVPKVVGSEAEAALIDGAIVVKKGKTQRSEGKPCVPEVFKPLKKSSKRGAVVDFFYKDTPQSVPECLSTLGITRSNMLSHLYCANRDQGWGYEITGDCIRTVTPEGEQTVWIDE